MYSVGCWSPDLHLSTRKGMNMSKQTMIVWQGVSELDGVTPVVVLASFESANVKTGNMVQTWILRADIAPNVAIREGSDTAVELVAHPLPLGVPPRGRISTSQSIAPPSCRRSECRSARRRPGPARPCGVPGAAGRTGPARATGPRRSRGRWPSTGPGRRPPPASCLGSPWPRTAATCPAAARPAAPPPGAAGGWSSPGPGRAPPG